MKKKMMILSVLLMTTACWAEGDPLSAIASATPSLEQGGGQEGGALFEATFEGGAIFIDVTGGVQPSSSFRVNIKDGSGFGINETKFGNVGQTTFNFLNASPFFPDGLPASQYTFTVTELASREDNEGASAEASQLWPTQSFTGMLDLPRTDLNFSFVELVPDQFVVGENGSIKGIVTGGMPSYLVALLNTNLTPIDTRNVGPGEFFEFSGLSGDLNYILLATDNSAISNSFLKGFFPFPACDLSFTTEVTFPGVRCSPPGNIFVTITGGKPDFTVEIRQDGTLIDSDSGPNRTFFFTNFDPGEYTITVTDEDGCSRTQEDVTVPTGLSFTTLVTPENCDDGQLGSIEVTVSGGFPPYTLFRDGDKVGGPQMSPIFNIPDLEGDLSYQVEVVDDSGCDFDATVIVPLNDLDCSVVNTTPQNFEQGTGGTIIVEVTGGVKPYTVEVTNQPTQTGDGPKFTFDNLPADKYNITVTTMQPGVVSCPCTQCVVILSDNPILNFTNVKYCGDVCP